jgi:hypothetical protein
MTHDSKPYLEGFNPHIIPFQAELMNLYENWDYDSSTPEILCTGAYGSSKSIIAAHIACMHCLTYPGAVVFIGRRALPDLKKTIFLEICEHLNTPSLIEGVHYSIKETTAEITFFNGSKVISGSWSDRKYKKFRSLKISMFILEEAAENDLQDKEAFMNIKARLRRLKDSKGNSINGPMIVLTNPSTPEHWLYEYFIEGEKEYDTRKVLYSVTSDNIFLDPIYIQQLLKDLSPKEARRYIFGEWISLNTEVIYEAYNEDRNFSNTDYTVDTSYPVCMSTDFNIAEGKPMSWVFFQYIDDHFHFFDESVIYSARTENSLDDCYDRGLFSHSTIYQIYGDAAGKNKSTNSKKSDYEIIYEFLERNEIPFEKKVLPSNPAIRRRHSIVNSYCLNALGEVRLTVYAKCKMLNKGMKLTRLKENASFIEDDSKSCPWQHSTTALGYGIFATIKNLSRKSFMRQL